MGHFTNQGMEKYLRYLILVTILATVSTTKSRDGRAITWADVLQGKSGYPSVNIQGGYQRTLRKTLQSTTTTPPSTTTITYPERTNVIADTQTYPDTFTQYDHKYTAEPIEIAHKPYLDKFRSQNFKKKTVVNNQKKMPPYEIYNGVPKDVSNDEHKNLNNHKDSHQSDSISITTTEKSKNENTYVPNDDNLIHSDVKYDFGEYGDYDEEFFDNNFYEYVDETDTDEIKAKLKAEEKILPTGNNQTADDRALDFLYHMFLDPSRHSKTDRRPFLIEEIFSTIDQHVIDDITAWTENRGSNALSSLVLNKPKDLFKKTNTNTQEKVPQIYLPPIINSPTTATPQLAYVAPNEIPQASFLNPNQVSIDSNNNQFNLENSNAQNPSLIGTNSISPNFSGDKFLVTDQSGNQLQVSIDDIITSLAQLDEPEISNLLLGGNTQQSLPISNVGQNNIPISDNLIHNTPQSQTPDATNFGVPLSQIDNRQANLNNVGVPLSAAAPQNIPNIERPTRQIGNNIPTSDEVFLIKNKAGNVQLVTMDDILKSLKNFNSPNSGHNQSPPSEEINSQILSSIINELPGDPDITTLKINELLNQKQNRNPTVIKQTISSKPIVTPDDHGNIHVSLNKPGQSSIIDLNDDHVKFKDSKYTQRLDQSPIVKTDNNGNVHIYPNNKQPFNLDLKHIISLAENIEKQKSISNVEPTTTQSPGEDILAFLGGEENLPRPIRSSRPNTNSNIQTSSNLYQTIDNNSGNIFPNIITPTQYYGNHNHIPTSTKKENQERPGISDTFSQLFSQLLGRNNQEIPTTQPPNPWETQNQNDILQLVVRQQNKGPGEQVFGHVNIELPKPIHYQSKARTQNTVQSDANRRQLHINSPNTIENNSETPQHRNNALSRLNLPTTVENYLMTQMKDTPKFHFPANNINAQSRNYNTGYTYEYQEPEVQYTPTYNNHYNHNPVPNDDPLFQLNFLADVVKVEKVGKRNKSVHLPKIGDSTDFVNTKKYHYYRRK